MQFIRSISTSQNKTYKELLNISKGKEKGFVLVEGEDLVYEANVYNNLTTLIVLEKDAISEDYIKKYKNLDVIKLPLSLYRELSSYQSLPKIMGVSKLNLISDVSSVGNKVLYLDCLQDGGNVGTLIRTALAFKYDSVILSKDSISVFSKKVLQSSKGSIFKIKIGIFDLNELKSNHDIYVTSLDGEFESNYTCLKEPFVIVMGNEGHGVRKEYIDIATKKLKIDIGDIDSLNVAIAGAIFMYRFH